MTEEKRLRWARSTIATHKSKGFMVTLRSRELYEMVKDINNCSICGCKLNWNGGKVSNISPSLDRIDNEMFITKDNIQIVCHRCNRLKGTMLMSEFVSYCNIVADNFKGDNYISEIVSISKEEQVRLIKKQKEASEEFKMAIHIRKYYEELYLNKIIRNSKMLNQILDETNDAVVSMRNKGIPEDIIIKGVIQPSIRALSVFDNEVGKWAVDSLENLKLDNNKQDIKML